MTLSVLIADFPPLTLPQVKNESANITAAVNIAAMRRNFSFSNAFFNFILFQHLQDILFQEHPPYNDGQIYLSQALCRKLTYGHIQFCY